MSVLTAVKRYRIDAEDRLRYSPFVRGLLSRLTSLREQVSPGTDSQALARSVARLCTAARLTDDPARVERIQRRIHSRVRRLDPHRVDWAEFVPDIEERRVARGVILKPWVGPREPGVVFVSFESEWIKLLRHCDLRAFSQRYALVVAPSWSPHSLVNYVFPTAYPGPVFSLISHPNDPGVIPHMAPNYRVVPLLASHWVNPGLFNPRPRAERDIDIVMVANFGKFKRHHALFTGLRKMPPQIKVLLVGQDQDARTAATIREEARCYGVDGRLTIRSNAPYGDVLDALCRSRVSVILSRREGSCVAVAESLFADTPAALLEDAAVGSRAFINPATGRFLSGHGLAAQLEEFIAEADRYAPRRWAEEHISCFRSTRVLNAALREHARAAGGEWSRDIWDLCWRPDPRLVHLADEKEMLPEREAFRERFGLDLGPA